MRTVPRRIHHAAGDMKGPGRARSRFFAHRDRIDLFDLAVLFKRTSLRSGILIKIWWVGISRKVSAAPIIRIAANFPSFMPFGKAFRTPDAI